MEEMVRQDISNDDIMKVCETVGSAFQAIFNGIKKLSRDERESIENSIKILQERYDYLLSNFNLDNATQSDREYFMSETADITKKLVELDNKKVEISEKDKDRINKLAITGVVSAAAVTIIALISKAFGKK